MDEEKGKSGLGLNRVGPGARRRRVGRNEGKMGLDYTLRKQKDP